jgi:hypothetical protein
MEASSNQQQLPQGQAIVRFTEETQHQATFNDRDEMQNQQGRQARNVQPTKAEIADDELLAGNLRQRQCAPLNLFRIRQGQVMNAQEAAQQPLPVLETPRQLPLLPTLRKEYGKMYGTLPYLLGNAGE